MAGSVRCLQQSPSRDATDRKHCLKGGAVEVAVFRSMMQAVTVTAGSYSWQLKLQLAVTASSLLVDVTDVQ